MSVFIDVPHCQSNSCHQVSFLVDITNPHSRHTIATPDIHSLKDLALERSRTLQHALGINGLQFHRRRLGDTKKLQWILHNHFHVVNKSSTHPVYYFPTASLFTDRQSRFSKVNFSTVHLLTFREIRYWPIMPQEKSNAKIQWYMYHVYTSISEYQKIQLSSYPTC